MFADMHRPLHILMERSTVKDNLEAHSSLFSVFDEPSVENIELARPIEVKTGRTASSSEEVGLALTPIFG